MINIFSKKNVAIRKKGKMTGKANRAYSFLKAVKEKNMQL